MPALSGRTRKAVQGVRAFAVPLLLLLLSGCAFRLDQFTARTAGDKTASDATTLMRVADRMRAEGANETALSVYRQAATATSSGTEPLIGEGEALRALGNYAAAAEAYSAALRLNPDEPKALKGLSVALIRNGQPRIALGPIAKLKALDPQHVYSYRLAGVAYDLIGDHAAAQAQYRIGMAKAPGDTTLPTNLALSLALSNDFAGAVALLRPLVERSEATARLRQNLALVYGLAGERQDAARIARLDLDDAAVQHNLEFYEQLCSMSPDARARVLLTGAP